MRAHTRHRGRRQQLYPGPIRPGHGELRPVHAPAWRGRCATRCTGPATRASPSPCRRRGPAMRAANTACMHFIGPDHLGQAGLAARRISAPQLAELTNYARCMRSHDIAMLDPITAGDWTWEPARASPATSAATRRNSAAPTPPAATCSPRASATTGPGHDPATGRRRGWLATSGGLAGAGRGRDRHGGRHRWQPAPAAPAAPPVTTARVTRTNLVRPCSPRGPSATRHPAGGNQLTGTYTG